MFVVIGWVSLTSWVLEMLDLLSAELEDWTRIMEEIHLNYIALILHLLVAIQHDLEDWNTDTHFELVRKNIIILGKKAKNKSVFKVKSK